MKMLEDMSLEELLAQPEIPCDCGRVHKPLLRDAVLGSGVINELPRLIKKYGGSKAFVLCDRNTRLAAGEAVSNVLQNAGIPYTLYCVNADKPAPDEKLVGSVIMHNDAACDIVVGVGSGVINDSGKILAGISGRPYIIVGTAPSMDGYASATSSMERDGLKVSLPSACPTAVIGDTDILCKAPMPMLQAGVGDMLAKYVSICEWRIGAMLCGEYYCPHIAELIRRSLAKVVAAADGLTRREPEAVKAVMEGMILSGIAANAAGISRPASGLEHYISHVWDMRSLAFGTNASLHGLQCGTATAEVLKVYELLQQYVPDRQKAQEYVRAFSFSAWSDELRRIIGGGAEAMINGEYKEGKYDAEKHCKRLEVICSHWEELLTIMREELPAASVVAGVLRRIGAPSSAEELGFTVEELHNALLASKDIRDKYVGSRLLWDLGILEETADRLYPTE